MEILSPIKDGIVSDWDLETEEEAEWCWRWLRKKKRRQKEAEILEIGKRRMIVADPKAVVGGIIPISPYTTVYDKALTAENLKVLGTPAREIIKVHPLLSLCKIQAKAKKKIGARFDENVDMFVVLM
ncbi:hypothetical protein Bca52824_074684 [Brassica carinata]|uniref:Uncharacterized protein n=1 Tax=Brassica carinata TaxID=52824 RepID=A0A8X7TUQ2_BRACI|nr:hypothetical protein Bca52824_074684 [Brassica carinata]